MKKLSLLLTSSLIWAGLSAPALAADAVSVNNDDVAIIIGNKSYQDSDITEVSYAHNDAQAMRSFVEDVLKIREENIIYLEDATQAKMLSAFGREGNYRGKAYQYVKPEKSNLYVFYSGHGMPGTYNSKSYLLPVDSDIETAEINGYPTDLLYENLSKIGAKSVTVFLDACFSGNSHGGTLIQRASGAQILPVQKPTTETDNITVLTAASQDQLASWDDENEHGLFTEYLMRALYGEADKDKDGYVRLAEVSDFLKEDMRYRARRTFNRDQIPTVVGDDERVMVAAIDGIYPTRPERPEEEQLTPEPLKAETEGIALTPVEYNMFALKNANVRREPDVRSRKVMVLPKGEPVHVAAKVTNKPWYAIEMGDDIVGYVFQDLLGEEKEIATEEENRGIRELKARLEKLEQQTRISARDILPEPPEPQMDEEEDLEPIEPMVMEREMPSTIWSNPEDPYDEIEDTLKTMGALLLEQSFIKRAEGYNAKTSFNYNWVRVYPDTCQIKASISFEHDKRASYFPTNDSIRVHDRIIQGDFSKEYGADRRKVRIKAPDGEVIQKTVLFKYGPFTFKDKQDRREFVAEAEFLRELCPTAPQVKRSSIEPSYKPADFEDRRYRRPPPPPPHARDGKKRRPPPPFHN